MIEDKGSPRARSAARTREPRDERTPRRGKKACLLLVLAIGCKNGPSDDQCKQLLDHLVDLEFKKAGAAASSDAMKADLANKKTVTEKVQAEFLDTCSKKMSKARVECALNANALDGDSGVAKCDESK